MDHLKDKIYGTIIGGVLGDILCSAQVQLDLRYGALYKIKQPLDLSTFGINQSHWTENTSTFLALLTALQHDTEPLLLYREVLYQGKFTCSQVYLDQDTISLCTRTHTQANSHTHSHSHLHNPGSLVRTSAISLHYFNSYEDILRESHANSMLTHNCLECADVCKLFSSIIDSALHGRSKKEILSADYYGNLQLSVELWGILSDITLLIPDPELGLNNTQLVLYQVLYCFKKSNNFKDGLVMILTSDIPYKNFVGTLYGQLSGAYYGLTDIDECWLDNLDGENLTDLANQCFNNINHCNTIFSP